MPREPLMQINQILDGGNDQPVLPVSPKEQAAAEGIVKAIFVADATQAPIPDTPGGLFAVAVLLAGIITEDSLAKILPYLLRLHYAGRPEFAVYAVRNAVARESETGPEKHLVQCAAFTELCLSPIGRVIAGEAVE